MSRLHIILKRLVNENTGPLSADENFVSQVFAVFYGLKAALPTAYGWKLESHGAHGFYYDLLFSVITHTDNLSIKVCIFLDLEPGQKLYWYQNEYYDTVDEVVTAIQESIN